MAEVFAASGEDTDSAFVPAPVMTGEFLGSLETGMSNGLGLRYPYGSTSGLRKMADTLISSGEDNKEVSSQLLSLISVLNRPSEVRNYYFDGLIGPPGPPGPVGPSGIGISGNAGIVGIQGATGASAFSDIDIPIPFDGWEGAFTNNSPIAGSVAWTSFKIKYQGTDYTIAAGNTAKVWLYWSTSATTVISSSDTRTDAVGAGKWFIGANNSGTFEQSQFIKLVTSGFISVTQLSALAADLGTITAGTITGGIIRTAASGARVELDGSSVTKQIAAYNAGGDQTFQVKDDGSGYWGILVGGVRPIEISAAGAVSVNTEGLAANAATVPASAYTAGSVGLGFGSYATLQSKAVVTTGGPVLIAASCTLTEGFGGVEDPELALFRGTTELISTGAMTLGVSEVRGQSLMHMDTPAAGSYTYYLKGQNTNPTTPTATKRSLSIIEFKR